MDHPSEELCIVREEFSTMSLQFGRTKARVVIEPLPAGEVVGQRSYLEAVAEIRRRQTRRGHTPPVREAIDAYLRAEREAWEG